MLVLGIIQTPQKYYGLQCFHTVLHLHTENVRICICYNLHMQSTTDCVILSTSFKEEHLKRKYLLSFKYEKAGEAGIKFVRNCDIFKES